MKKLHVLAICLLMATAIASCRKNDDGVTPIDNTTPKGSHGSIAAVYNKLGVKSKSVTIDAAVGGSFRGNSGSRYIFQPSAFRDASGNIVTGNVTIEVKEFLKRSDMIFSKVLPVSNGQPLISGGEVYVKATQNGNPLHLADGMMYTVQIPQFGANSAGMDLFLGAPVEDPLNTVNWMQVRKDSAQGGGHGGMGGIIFGNDTISLFSDSVGYANADQFLTNPNYVSFTINVTGVSGLTAGDVSAYALYDNYNGLWPMSNFSNGVITEGHVPDIPVHFVVIAVVNGHFYGGVAGATPSNGGNYTVNLSETDPNTFKGQIDNL